MFQESLTQRIEKLDDVEKAFIHSDYEIASMTQIEKTTDSDTEKAEMETGT